MPRVFRIDQIKLNNHIFSDHSKIVSCSISFRPIIHGTDITKIRSHRQINLTPETSQLCAIKKVKELIDPNLAGISWSETFYNWDKILISEGRVSWLKQPVIINLNVVYE